MYLTKDNLKKIEQYIKASGIRDSELPSLKDELDGSEYITIVRNNQNFKLHLSELNLNEGMSYTYISAEDEDDYCIYNENTLYIIVNNDNTIKDIKLGNRSLIEDVINNNQLRNKNLDSLNANKLYYIKDDINLNGSTITLPNNIILEFIGGSITNGTLVLNNTILRGIGNIDANIEGTIIGTLQSNLFNLNKDELIELAKSLQCTIDWQLISKRTVLSEKSIQEQLSNPNYTCYSIDSLIDLQGETVTIDNKVLDFTNGGTLYNGTLNLNKVRLIPENIDLSTAFQDITIEGDKPFIEGQTRCDSVGEYEGQILIYKNNQWEPIANDVKVGDNNSIMVNNVTYSLVYNDGVIQFETSISASFGNTYFVPNTITGAGSYEVGSNPAFSIVPSNTINIEIKHGSKEIALTGIATFINGQWRYVTGSYPTITNGIVQGASYENSDYTAIYELPYNMKLQTATKQGAGTITIQSQTYRIDFHQKGNSSINSMQVTSNPLTATATCDKYGIYYGTTLPTKSNIKGKNLTNTLPSSVTIDMINGNGYIAIPKAFCNNVTDTIGETPKSLIFSFDSNFSMTGGMLYEGELSVYGTNDYNIYKTTNSNLGQRTIYIKK